MRLGSKQGKRAGRCALLTRISVGSDGCSRHISRIKSFVSISVGDGLKLQLKTDLSTSIVRYRGPPPDDPAPCMRPFDGHLHGLRAAPRPIAPAHRHPSTTSVARIVDSLVIFTVGSHGAARLGTVQMLGVTAFPWPSDPLDVHVDAPPALHDTGLCGKVGNRLVTFPQHFYFRVEW